MDSIRTIRTIRKRKKKTAAALQGAELSVNGSPWNCRSVPWQEFPDWSLGKLSHSYGKSTMFEWVNQLFLWPWSIANCSPLPGRISHIPDPGIRWPSGGVHPTFSVKKMALKLWNSPLAMDSSMATCWHWCWEHQNVMILQKPMSTKIWIIHGCLFWGLFWGMIPRILTILVTENDLFLLVNVGDTSRFIPKKKKKRCIHWNSYIPFYIHYISIKIPFVFHSYSINMSIHIPYMFMCFPLYNII